MVSLIYSAFLVVQKVAKNKLHYGLAMKTGICSYPGGVDLFLAALALHSALFSSLPHLLSSDALCTVPQCNLKCNKQK